MLFTLKNLGLLETATIDLSKDMIVLTGPNNTSKTYVADAIYGLCKRSDVMVREVVAPLLNLGGSSFRVEIDLPALVAQHLGAMLPAIAAQHTRQLADVFATNDAFVSRASVQIDVEEGERARIEDALRALELTREIRGEGMFAAGGGWMFEKRAGAAMATVTWMPALNGSEEGPDSGYLASLALSFVAAVLAEALFGGTEQTTYILPAERSAIQLFSRELSSKPNQVIEALVGEVRGKSLVSRLRTDTELDALISRRARRYPLAISDSLQIAEDLPLAKKRTSEFAPLAVELDRDLMQGAIELDKSSDVGFRPQGSETRIDLHLASSSVRSLSALSLYLHHLARRGHFLIIDEPELNLHPHNQRLVARLLARLARAGIRVMISTHSDYVVRELNNLIMLSRDSDGELREKHGYREDELLSPERVGAYAFDGAHARPIPIGPEGMTIEAFDRDIRELNRSSRDIYFELEDRDEA